MGSGCDVAPQPGTEPETCDDADEQRSVTYNLWGEGVRERALELSFDKKEVA